MEIVTLILTAIRGVEALAGNRHINQSETVELLGILTNLVQIGGATYKELKAFTEQIGVMVAENRAPTQTEWVNFRARSNAAHNRLQAAKADILADD